MQQINDRISNFWLFVVIRRQVYEYVAFERIADQISFERNGVHFVVYYLAALPRNRNDYGDGKEKENYCFHSAP